MFAKSNSMKKVSERDSVFVKVKLTNYSTAYFLFLFELQIFTSMWVIKTKHNSFRLIVESWEAINIPTIYEAINQMSLFMLQMFTQSSVPSCKSFMILQSEEKFSTKYFMNIHSDMSVGFLSQLCHCWMFYYLSLNSTNFCIFLKTFIIWVINFYIVVTSL